MSDEIDDLIGRIADDFATPNIDSVYGRAKTRNLRRRRFQQASGALAAVAVIVGFAVWFNRAQPSEVATSVTQDAVGDDSAPVLLERPDQLVDEVRNALLGGEKWIPTERTGIPTTTWDDEAVYFWDANNVSFGTCESVSYDIDWTDDGFINLGRREQGATPQPGCDGPVGVGDLHINTGEEVTIANNNDGTYTLSTDTWSLRIEPPIAPAETDAAIDVQTNESQKLLTSGHRWHVHSRDGIPEPAEGSREELIFLASPDRLILSNCDLSIHSLEWTERGFVVGDEIPSVGEPSAIDCPNDPGGILNIPVGATVDVEVSDDGPSSVRMSAQGWSLLTRPTSISDAAPESEQDLELLTFLAPLELGRWKLVEGNESYPDRTELDQGISFGTLKDAGDRMFLYGQPCFNAQVFLQWNKPGQAVVTEDRSGIKVFKPSIYCEPSPGIANHPPAIGSTITVEGDGNFINVTLLHRNGSEEWNARFEYHQYHLLEDQ